MAKRKGELSQQTIDRECPIRFFVTGKRQTVTNCQRAVSQRMVNDLARSSWPRRDIIPA
jgi:hypothetical protein